MRRLLVTGRFKAAQLLAEIQNGTAPANHLLAAPLLAERGWQVMALDLTPQELASSVAFQRRVWRERANFDAMLAYNYHDIRLLCALKLVGLFPPSISAVVHMLRPRPWDRLALAGCNRLFALSNAAVTGLGRAGAAPSKIVYFRYGADAAFYRELPWPETPGIVLSVGVTGRDFGTLIQAARSIRAEVHIVGRVADQDAAGAPPNVKIHSSGNYDLPFAALTDLYARAACVVVAHRGTEDPNGLNAVMEAMAFGRPVVLTAGPGMDIDTVGLKIGAMVPPSDAEALAAAVNGLLSNAASTTAKGRTARKLVETHYSTQCMADTLDSALSSIRT